MTHSPERVWCAASCMVAHAITVVATAIRVVSPRALCSSMAQSETTDLESTMSTGTRGHSALSPVMMHFTDSLLGHAYRVMPNGGYMSKRHFISLADYIKEHNRFSGCQVFTEEQILVLARFCKSQNSAFDRSRWLSYIAGECGPNGGAVK